MAAQLPVWNLKEILNPKDIDAIIKEIEARVDRLAKREKQFTASMDAVSFKRIIIEDELIERAMSKLGTYAGNWFNENTKDQQAAALLSRVETIGADISNKLLFISQRFKTFNEKDAQRLIKACPEYAHHLRLIRLFKKHTLTEPEERIINVKNINGASALTKIYDMTTTSFRYKLGKRLVTQNELIKQARDPDPKKREEAYIALLEKFSEHKEILGEIYKHVVDDLGREVQLRDYTEPISSWNKQNELSDEAVATLLKVCKRNAKVFQEYFRKKAKLIGKKKLRRYDIYAPMAKQKRKLTYEKAVEITLEAFSAFHPTFPAAAQAILDGHVHARPQPNKYTGAYCCYPSPELPPFILLSYTDDMNSLRTLAHELGHGIHGILAKDQNLFNHHAPLPICETASTFAESLVNESLIKKQPRLAQELLASQLDDMYSTIGRQAWFVLFEIEAHKMVARHATVDEMSRFYYKQLQQQFGDSVSIDKRFKDEWVLIPHIYHTPFYCYAYSFGKLLALALYAQWKKEPAFADKIVAFLAKGGSESPEKMVEAAGFDLTDEKFWQSGFDVIKKMVKDL